MTHAGVAIALVATTIYNVGFVLEKRALTYLPVIDAHRIWSLLRTLFTARGWLAGFALILIGMVLQLVVLSLEPLTVAQPLQASGVVVAIDPNSPRISAGAAGFGSADLAAQLGEARAEWKRRSVPS